MARTLLGILLSASLLIGCTKDDDSCQCDKDNPNRTGAVCKDGTESTSVGSGTCFRPWWSRLLAL